jgi:hypothetical protein
MRAMAVIVALEIEELHLRIRGRPEQGVVQIFAPNGANQPFNEGMGERHVRLRTAHELAIRHAHALHDDVAPELERESPVPFGRWLAG